MRRNVWTMLGVFAVMFGLAWFLNRGKTRAISRNLPDRGSPVRSDVSSSPAPPILGQPPSPARRAAESPEISQSVPSPATDSISRTPPDGMVFSGRGRFQLYRQGDITWRLDTETGHACILLATDEQWRMERVVSRGCRIS